MLTASLISIDINVIILVQSFLKILQEGILVIQGYLRRNPHYLRVQSTALILL